MIARISTLPLMAATLLYLFVSGNFSSSGPEPQYSDKYPHLSFITSHNGSVWFAGSWSLRYVVVQRDRDGQWHTHVCPRKRPYLQAVRQSGNRLLFLCYAPSMSFDLDSRKWASFEEAKALSLLTPPPEDPDVEKTPQRIKVKQGDSLINYDFPLPSFNAYQRWRFRPATYSGLEANIGDTLHLRDCIWFAINFYAGEGTTGIGGLGILDPKRRAFGVLRDHSLSASSANRLVAKGDTIFVATGLGTEGGLMESSGLVIIDTRNGRMTHADRRNSPLLGRTFSSLKVVDDYLWMSTDEAIVGWDLKTDKWCAVRMDSVITNDLTTLSRRVHVFRHPNDWGSVIQDTLFPVSHRKKGTRLNLLWLDWDKAEFDTDSLLSGWVETGGLAEHRTYDHDQLAATPGVHVFGDSGLTEPFNYVKFGSIIDNRTSPRAVNVRVKSLWCDVSFVDPVFSMLWGSRRFVPQWTSFGGSFDSLLSRAFAEFLREQQEIINRVPVFDTTFTIQRNMDLYDKFDDLVDVRWLPSGDFTDRSPVGLKFEIDPFDKATTANVVCNRGQLTVNGAPYRPGSDLLIQTARIKATLRFTDPKFADTNGEILAAITVKYTLVLLPIRDQ
jgi:hypothetical protein